MKVEKWLKLVSCILILTSVLMTAGCGGGGSGGAGTSSGTATIYGLATLDNTPLENTAISVKLTNGMTVPLEETSTIDSGGAFSAKLSPSIPNGAFIVEATAANGEIFCTEVQGITNGGSVFVHINPLTTLSRAYHVKHPGISIAQARNKVHRYVGIPVHFDLGDQVAHSHYSRFSINVFMNQARLHPGGFAAYQDAVVQNIDSTAGLVEGASNNYSTSDFAGAIAPEWQNAVSRMGSPASTVEPAVAETFSIANSIGDGLIGNIIGLIIDHIPGLGSASTLDEIQSKLNEIGKQISEIRTLIEGLPAMIAQEFNQTDYTSIASSLTTQSADITGLYDQLQKIQADAYTPNMTLLPTDVQSLYANNNWVNTQINSDAITIHNTQFNGAGLTKPLLYYAKQLTYTDHFVTNNNIGKLQGQMNYYAGLQVMAMNALAAINSPSAGNIIGMDTPGGLRLQAAGWISTISANIQQEMAQQPLPALTQTQFADLKNAALYQTASVSMKTGGTSWNYAAALTDGGLNWVVADTATIQNTFNTIKGISGGTQQKFSAWMNANLGTNLKPGPVTWQKYGISIWSGNWVKLSDETATAKGYLTITYTGTSACGSGTCYGYTVGWIDDDGKSGIIGTTNTGTFGDIAVMLDDYNGNRGVSLPGSSLDDASHINGPCIIMVQKNNKYKTSASAVVAGTYEIGISTNAAFVSDPYSKGSSGTQVLTASPYNNDANPLPMALFPNYVYWTSSDAVNAPISNVQSSDGSDASITPTFPPVPNNAGTIHWLPGSIGKTVTFTATRQLPNGANVQKQVALTSPVGSSSPNPKGNPQAISVWPPRYNVTSASWANFKANGVQFYTTRHYGSGDCEDVNSTINQPPSNLANVTYSLSGTGTLDPTTFSISNQGFLQTSLSTIPASGTSLVITVTDPLVPSQTSEGNVRKTDICTITFN